MFKTLRPLLPLTFAALLASCGTTSLPAPQASAPDRALSALNDDICPSCGKAAQILRGAWVWAAPLLDLPVLREPLEPEGQWAAPPAGLPTQARVEFDGSLVHLTLEKTTEPALPVACFRPGQAPRPVALPALLLSPSGHASHTWTGGEVLLGGSLKASRLTSAVVGDQQCEAQFGPAWRMLRGDDTTDLLPQGLRAADLWAQQPKP